MFVPGWRLWFPLAALVLAVGCSSSPTPPADTGARAAAQRFFDALVQQDWPRAYETLHPDSRAAFDLERFTALAKNYCRHLGFEPREVYVRSCEEQGEEAIAHVMLTGHAEGARRSQYKDAAALRYTQEGWKVVPPAQFGRYRAK
jgi:hypothetical protein